MITLAIACLFNECMATGIFPDSLKTAKIIHIHKGDAKDDPTNYRPVSLMPILGKIFEKILADRLVNFLEKHNIITQNHFRFRKNHSTELAITEAYNSLLINLENNEHTCAISLDLAKAFDSVDHQILLKKIENTVHTEMRKNAFDFQLEVCFRIRGRNGHYTPAQSCSYRDNL